MFSRFNGHPRRLPPAVAILVIVGMLFGYLTSGVIAADPPEAIDGCFDGNSGILRVSETCRATETKLSWPSIELYEQDLALLTAQDTALAGRITALETALNDKTTALEGKIADLQAKDKVLDKDIAALAARVKLLEDAGFQAQINGLLGNIADLQSEDGATQILIEQLNESTVKTTTWSRELMQIVRLVVQGDFEGAVAKLTTLMAEVFPGTLVGNGLQIVIQNLTNAVAVAQDAIDALGQLFNDLWCSVFGCE